MTKEVTTAYVPTIIPTTFGGQNGRMGGGGGGGQMVAEVNVGTTVVGMSHADLLAQDLLESGELVTISAYLTDHAWSEKTARRSTLRNTARKMRREVGSAPFIVEVERQPDDLMRIRLMAGRDAAEYHRRYREVRRLRAGIQRG